MSKYVIHACPKRMWYVEQYLIPSLLEQGIEKENIDIRCDKFNNGNLDHCMQIFSVMKEDGGSWHLQDDIVICKDFKNRTKEYEGEMIISGFVWEKDERIDKVGIVTPEDMWWTFPCIYIPNYIALGCSKWFYERGKYNPKYTSWLVAGQYDDFFFKEYLNIYYPEFPINQIKPCLVDHIDYLIGGTTIGSVTRDPVRAKWFDDIDLVDELAEKLSGENANE